MKKLLILTIFITACTSNTTVRIPDDATQSEINMATSMGISVQDLRNQTPEEHMKMMMDANVHTSTK